MGLDAVSGDRTVSAAPISRSILSNGAGLAVNSLLSFLLTPVLIHHLGTFDYGMLILATSAVDYLALLDLGMRTTLFRFISRLRGAQDRVALDETFASALCMTAVVGAAVAVLTV